jgi:hypothetical protein
VYNPNFKEGDHKNGSQMVPIEGSIYSGLEVDTPSMNPGSNMEGPLDKTPEEQKKSRKGSRIKTIVKTKIKKKV